MSTPITVVYPISKARTMIGELVDKVSNVQEVYLTKNGNIAAALVDVDYLSKLKKAIKKLYTKTYIDTKLLPLTREFTDEEIEKWEAEDQI